MTQEEKDLLLKDLCARLPYGVKVFDDMGRTYTLNVGNAYFIDLIYGDGDYVEPPFKPYLRPMSSMTEEEELGFIAIGDVVLHYTEKKHICILSLEQMDWLNAHHFDYRGLIDKGLALEAPEGMYKKKGE